jgi:hypothetical protein
MRTRRTTSPSEGYRATLCRAALSDESISSSARLRAGRIERIQV